MELVTLNVTLLDTHDFSGIKIYYRLQAIVCHFNDHFYHYSFTLDSPVRITR